MKFFGADGKIRWDFEIFGCAVGGSVEMIMTKDEEL